jgi:hypothetical protein
VIERKKKERRGRKDREENKWLELFKLVIC